MNEQPRGVNAHVARVWTHTATVVGVIAAVVTIIGFFGIKPPSSQPKKDTLPVKQNESPKTEPPKTAPITSTGPAKSRGIGTIHFEGAFPVGQSYINKVAVPANDTPSPLVLLKPGGGEETLKEAVVVAPAEINQSVGVWRKGLQLLRGVHFKADHPTVRLSGAEVKPVDVPIDQDARLGADVVWPVKLMFTTAEFSGPVEVGGIEFGGGLTFGEGGVPEPGRTLPTRFTLNIPKPGEVLAEFKGELRYQGGSNERRFVVVRVQAPDQDTIATWSTEFNRFGPTIMRDDRATLLDRGPYSIKVLFSAN